MPELGPPGGLCSVVFTLIPPSKAAFLFRAMLKVKLTWASLPCLYMISGPNSDYRFACVLKV